MEAGKPLVSIVMAVYHPRMDWLFEQLDSLNTQTYPNLELIVCDDGPDQPVEEKVFREYITAFSWKLVRNDKNLGSNKTFERLTAMANGEYIAYCDQDDVWLPEKLDVLVELIQRTKAKLVCSDVIVIDACGNKKAGSIIKVRKRHVFQHGKGLSSYLIYRNFVIGCTMLLETKTAQAALPFPGTMVHDHWLALYASAQGSIEVADVHLVHYRIHSENQTNVLTNVHSKQEYIQVRIENYLSRLLEIQGRLPLGDRLADAIKWAQARKDYAHGDKSAAETMKRYKGCNPTTTEFELLLMRMPEWIFGWALRVLQTGKL